MQALIRELDPEGHVLPLVFYSDGAMVMNNRTVHPVVVYIASAPLEAIRSKRGGERLVLLPEIDTAALGMSSDK